MDGKTLSRIGAIAFVVIAITLTAIDLRQAPESEAAAIPIVTVAPSGSWQAELVRCQSIGQAGASDAACLRAWAENRRRFLSPGARAVPTTPISPVMVPASESPEAIANQIDAPSPSPNTRVR